MCLRTGNNKNRKNKKIFNMCLLKCRQVLAFNAITCRHFYALFCIESRKDFIVIQEQESSSQFDFLNSD